MSACILGTFLQAHNSRLSRGECGEPATGDGPNPRRRRLTGGACSGPMRPGQATHGEGTMRAWAIVEPKQPLQEIELPTPEPRVAGVLESPCWHLPLDITSGKGMDLAAGQDAAADRGEAAAGRGTRSSAASVPGTDGKGRGLRRQTGRLPLAAAAPAHAASRGGQCAAGKALGCSERRLRHPCHAPEPHLVDPGALDPALSATYALFRNHPSSRRSTGAPSAAQRRPWCWGRRRARAGIACCARWAPARLGRRLASKLGAARAAADGHARRQLPDTPTLGRPLGGPVEAIIPGERSQTARTGFTRLQVRQVVRGLFARTHPALR